MTIRSRRRPRVGADLEKMTDTELNEIYFFGYVCTDPFTVTFRATDEEREQARQIMKRRDAKRPPMEANV